MIKVENVSKDYELADGTKITALKNVSFEVKEGEILGIMGKSGSGKTTLLRALRGVEHIDNGIIEVGKAKVTSESSQFYYNNLKKETAIHLQRSFGIWPDTVRENVLRKLYARRYFDEGDTNFEIAESEFGKEADELLELVSLTDKQDHYASVLSGGEKQRLIMARQLAKQPKALLLDEPATMACPKTKQEILDAVKKINKELNITVVVVSHLPDVQKYLADRVILLENGEIAEEGSANEICDKFMDEMDDIVDIDNIATDEDVIQVNDIYKRFFLLTGGEVLQIEDVNFTVQKENILSIIGPSGAGKTVLLRMLGGLEDPDEGEVLYNVDDEWSDIDIPGMGRMKIRSKLGFMHQEFALNHYSTVLNQLATRLGYKNQNIVKEAQQRARKIGLSEELLDSFYLLTDLPEIEARDRLKKVGLDSDILDDLFPRFPETATKEAVADIFESLDLDMSILHRKSYELSGGQKVRVMLALILVSRPKFLLLDEPFGDLDPVTLRDVTNALKKISKDYGITIVMISHNTDFIKELSNRAVFMDDGKIIDDSEDIDKIVDNFIDFCHADYLKGE
ncbi:methyl coenzyme M reductase system, component A2 [Methanobrevibacter gottschalkii]|uniref:Methyl coenzyme M reductase system subunit A2 n=2 Tax=Methanobrevibacter gottschalkii TaxID=190974 RepID=A0A3N5B3F4_9EURY|nr:MULTISPECIES: ATP-binding cassette domain-containing protein [Methanobrevibacter]MCQ2971474.1 ATP-binding cassette domain-containing protein [archaeon]OEC94531.1 ABC transporter ATP-binding protein [Methanobrevibacter sp. A27]RPF51833.1 methyl coenzyme M reductase system subunit A2 [Methanobrevibacter gottschalkii DSM 11977]SEK94452.1 methyl coenzyme M reductase system, component A2 [Methanobrevibacter gottschalkii]